MKISFNQLSRSVWKIFSHTSATRLSSICSLFQPTKRKFAPHARAPRRQPPRKILLSWPLLVLRKAANQQVRNLQPRLHQFKNNTTITRLLSRFACVWLTKQMIWKLLTLQANTQTMMRKFTSQKRSWENICLRLKKTISSILICTSLTRNNLITKGRPPKK